MFRRRLLTAFWIIEYGTLLCMGCVNQKREPFPYSDSTPIVPPRCSMILLQIDSFKPVPFEKVFSFTNRSNTWLTLSGAMPIPVSVTENSILLIYSIVYEAFLLFKSTGHSFKRNDLLHTAKCIVSFKGTRFSINRLRWVNLFVYIYCYIFLSFGFISVLQ